MKLVRTAGFAICMALLFTTMVAASSASAAQFRAEEYPTTVIGSQTVKQKFTAYNKGPFLECSNVTSTGTISEPVSTTLSMAPSFSGCVFGGLKATVKVNSCKYVFHNSSEQLVNEATMDIACSKEGDQIEVAAPGCTLYIPAQTNRGPVQLDNNEGLSGGYHRKIDITPNATGFKDSLVGSWCSGSHEDGVMSGNTLVKGLNAQHEVGVYLSNEQSVNHPMFAAGKNPEVVEAALTGEAEANFPGGNIGFSCSSLNGNGLISGAAKGQLTLHLASWSGCNGITSNLVHRNGCSFTLAGPIGAAGSLAIECPTGKELSVLYFNSNCSVTIPSQGLLSTVTYTNTGSGETRVVKATVGITNMKYTPSGGCTQKSGQPQQDGKLSFTWSLTGYKLKETILEEEEGVQFLRYLRGETQQAIWVE